MTGAALPRMHQCELPASLLERVSHGRPLGKRPPWLGGLGPGRPGPVADTWPLGCRHKSKQALRDYQKVLVQLENLEIGVGDQCRKEFTGRQRAVGRG